MNTDIKVNKTNDQMEKRFERIIPRNMEEFFHRGFLHPLNWELPLSSSNSGINILPKTDIIEKDEELILRAEIPGIEKEKINIEATASSVIIKGSTQEEKSSTQGEYHKHETIQESFYRTLSLPCKVISDSAKANYKDGILTITLKKQQATKRHKVNIS